MLISKIDARYRQHSADRIAQGDIARDFSFIVIDKSEAERKIIFPYIIVMSQDCDLEQCSNFVNDSQVEKEKKSNQHLHSVLFLPSFPSGEFREGEHLSDFGIKTDRINSDLWRKIKINENPRYHFLKSDENFQVPEMVVDFKAYYTLPLEYFQEQYEYCYLASLSELFREDLSLRFANYLTRIGLPNI
ncbi:MAG: hypothetical protein FXF54_09200 [Kosmotoga sp.]|nr:MAG: hypothetical protein FXF54_09200 [Kosmotoga sp.]